LNHTRITTAQQDNSCRLGKPPGTHTKLEKDQPCLPQIPSPSFKHKPNQELIQDQSSTATI